MGIYLYKWKSYFQRLLEVAIEYYGVAEVSFVCPYKAWEFQLRWFDQRNKSEMNNFILMLEIRFAG
jgi:hypothetical protein